MWGNFHTQLTGTDLIRFQRSLYGGEIDWRSAGSTPSGERRTQINGFAADPGTIASREELASTGGSVYCLRNQDIAQGSVRLFMEVRDRDSGLVLSRQELIVARDYDMVYIQGRVLLRSNGQASYRAAARASLSKIWLRRDLSELHQNTNYHEC